MVKKQREEIFEVFAEAFHDVVVPEIQEVKEEIKEINGEIKEIKAQMATKGDIDKLERQYQAVQRRIDRQDEKIEQLKIN